MNLKNILPPLIFLQLIYTSFPQIKIHKNLTVEDGLVQSQVTAIFKDSKGFLWFGTLGGISIWDGINFQNYQIQDGLSSPMVSAIIEDSSGRIFIATNGGGVTVFNNGFKDTLTTAGGLADNHVYAACAAKSGIIYFGTASGISIYSKDHFSTLNESNGLINNRVTSIFESRDGSVYFCTAGGVTVLKNGELLNITTEDGLPDNKVTSVREDSLGGLYFGTLEGGVAVLKNDKFTLLNQENGLTGDAVFTVAPGKDNTMYFGMWGSGVNIFRNGSIEKITAAEGLGNDVVMSVFEDENGIVFLGTDGGGVSIFGGGKIINWNKQSGLAESSVRAVHKSRSGEILFGTDAEGVTVVSGEKIINLNESNGLADSRIRAFYEMENGEILIGTFGGGVSIYKNGRIAGKSFNSLLNDKRIKIIYEDNSGNLLFGTYNDGLYFWKDGNIIKNLNEENGLSSNFINTVFQDKDNTYYIGTWGGLNIIRNDTISVLNTGSGLANNYVNSVYKSSDGKIFIATDGGLNILDKGKISVLNTRNGLSDNTILGIAQDHLKRIYLPTNRGINILENKNGSYSVRTLRYSDGLASDECNQGAVYKDDNGCLWFGTSKGVSFYNPLKDVPNKIPPRIYISRARIFDKDILNGKSSAYIFNHNENYIKFDFIGINIPVTDKVIYRCRLSGIDNDWVETGQRFVQYTNLDHGSYNFEVKAMNEWGYWSNPAVFSFVISPPFWKTWWFITVSVLVLVFLLWYLNNLRTQKLLAVEKIRLRIASDLHDDIGATLTHIAVNSELIKHSNDTGRIKEAADKIGSLSRKVTETMSDIVWSINSRNDTVDNLVERMQDFAQQVLSPKDSELNFRSQGFDPSEKIDVDVRENIYLIFKEAVNNISKHSTGTRVDVSLESSKDFFKMIISDNGQIEPEKIKSSGNGLKNIKMRAEKISGSAEICIDNGFSIKITSKPLRKRVFLL